MSTLEPGERFAERYVIVERVGEGGMGVVYAARDEKLRRNVAIKVLAAKRVANKEARARLKREARAAAAFAHPGIAQVFDAGETPDGGAYLVMELVRGKSVRGQLAPGLPQAEALRMLRALGRTLGAAHRAGLVHRDVKPDNIMICDDGRVVLLDFGIAKEVGQRGPVGRSTDESAADSVVTAQGTMLGTPPYIAPEQIRGKDVGPASDQFALAVVAFGFLTGNKPWEAPTELGLLGQILMDAPFVATAVAPSLPGEVDAVFERALSKQPAQRFPDVESFVGALESALTGKEYVRAPADPPPALDAAAVGIAPENTPVRETPAENAPAEGEVGGQDAQAAPAHRPIVWKIRVDEPTPRRSPWLLLVGALVIAIVAAAAGVWYGRTGEPPRAPAGRST